MLSYAAQLEYEGNPNPEVFTRPGIERLRVFQNPFFDKVRRLLINRDSVTMSETDLQNEFKLYKDNKVIDRADAFVCAFPAALCEFAAMFNKSIIVNTAHRFNLDRCISGDIRRWHQKLAEYSKDKKNVVSAMSRYDLEYLNYYLNLPNSQIISSLSGFYTRENVYEATEKEVLIYQA